MSETSEMQNMLALMRANRPAEKVEVDHDPLSGAEISNISTVAQPVTNEVFVGPVILLKIFMDAKAQYYAATEPKDPADCYIPSPSPNLLKSLSESPGEVVHNSNVRAVLAQVGNGANSAYTNTGIVL